MNAETKVKIIGGEMSPEEQEYYLDEIKRKNPFSTIRSVEITIEDDEYVSISCELENRKFERIRRITGYLVGTLDRFNDAKRAEESRRVKHSVE